LIVARAFLTAFAMTAAFAAGAAVPVQSLGVRTTVTPTETAYGGFELTQATTVLILARGSSLRRLGIAQNPLLVPRLRVFRDGMDIAGTADPPGVSLCSATPVPPGGNAAPAVIAYYRDVRRQPAEFDDTCFSAFLEPGVYTFTVTPGIQGITVPGTGRPTQEQGSESGEVLVEVTLR
jgi:hypothetical protein